MSDLIERVEAARRFPTNTCPASRHAALIGEALMRGEPYPMLTDEPDHCGESILSAVASLWEARTEIERLQIGIELLDAADADLRTKLDAASDLAEMTASERDEARAERDELRRQLDEAQKEIHNLNWALGTEGYDQMATPEEQAEHEAAVRAHHDVLERLEEGKRAYEAIKQDARRYRDWLRGGANIPPESTRWPRWEVRHWNGRYWNTLFAEQMDAAIDAAMGGGDAG